MTVRQDNRSDGPPALPAGLLRELCGVSPDPDAPLDSAVAGGSAETPVSARDAWSRALDDLSAEPELDPALWGRLALALDAELAGGVVRDARPLLADSTAGALAGPVGSPTSGVSRAGASVPGGPSASASAQGEGSTLVLDATPKSLAPWWRNALFVVAASFLLVSFLPPGLSVRQGPPAARLNGVALDAADVAATHAILRSLCAESDAVDLERFLVLEQAARLAEVEAVPSLEAATSLRGALEAVSRLRDEERAVATRGVSTGLLAGPRSGDLAAGGGLVERERAKRVAFTLALVSEPDAQSSAPELPLAALRRVARVRAYTRKVAASSATTSDAAARARAAADHLRDLRAKARGLDERVLARLQAWRGPPLALRTVFVPRGGEATLDAARRALERGSAPPLGVLASRLTLDLPPENLRETLAQAGGLAQQFAVPGGSEVVLSAPHPSGARAWWSLPLAHRDEATRLVERLNALPEDERVTHLVHVSRRVGMPGDAIVGLVEGPHLLGVGSASAEPDAASRADDSLRAARTKPGEVVRLDLAEGTLFLVATAYSAAARRERALEAALALPILKAS